MMEWNGNKEWLCNLYDCYECHHLHNFKIIDEFCALKIEIYSNQIYLLLIWVKHG